MLHVMDRLEPLDRDALVSEKAEEIACTFESPILSPNLLVWRSPDEPLRDDDWRRAARQAGKLLNRKVRTHLVHAADGDRLCARLVPNELESAAEERRLVRSLDAARSG